MGDNKVVQVLERENEALRAALTTIAERRRDELGCKEAKWECHTCRQTETCIAGFAYRVAIKP